MSPVHESLSFFNTFDLKSTLVKNPSFLDKNQSNRWSHNRRQNSSFQVYKIKRRRDVHEGYPALENHDAQHCSTTAWTPSERQSTLPLSKHSSIPVATRTRSTVEGNLSTCTGRHGTSGSAARAKLHTQWSWTASANVNPAHFTQLLLPQQVRKWRSPSFYNPNCDGTIFPVCPSCAPGTSQMFGLPTASHLATQA